MKRVIVTGGLGVLGRVVAETFAELGDEVVRIDRDATSLPMGIGKVNLANPAEAEAAFLRAQSMMGGVDVLVNIAGGFCYSPLTGGAPQVWDEMFTANLKTCANMCWAAGGRITNGGTIVNVGAAAADRAGVGMGPYAASKAGVAKLTESLAVELRGRVRVNGVLPLILDTPQNRADMPEADPAAWTRPAAVADLVVFLASDASRAVNGAMITATAATSW